MPVLSRIGCSVVLIALSVAIAACNPDDPPLQAPSPLDPVTIVSVNLDGPARLSLGESAQYTATVNLSNFVTKSSPTVRWIASPPSFLRVNAAGVATGGPFSGGAAVTAEVTLPNGKTVAKSLGVTVLPKGTFLLVGTVTDAERHPQPARGAKVEATDGSVSSGTDANGFYRLYGVSANPEIRVSADGYQTVTQTLEIGSDTRFDFRLSPLAPGLNLNGPYTLTLEVTDNCNTGTPLPANLRQRQYDATLTQSGQSVQVVLTEPRFLVAPDGTGNRFSGQAFVASATFDFPWRGEPGDQPAVVERLPDGTFLIVTGSVEIKPSGTGLSSSGAGIGLQQYGPGFPGTQTFLGYCTASRFTLTPR